MTRSRLGRAALPAGVGIVVVGLLLAVAAYADRHYEVIGTTEKITSVRIDVLGLFTYDSTPEVRPTLDIFNSFLLITISSMALLSLFLLRAVGALPGHTKRFYFFLWLGAGLLAVDEFFGVHEDLGYNLRDALDVFGAHQPDDVIFASYAIPAVIFLYVFRDVILSTKRALRLFGVALVVFLFGIVVDATNLSTPLEDSMEILASICILAGSIALMVDHVTGTLQVRRLVPNGHPEAAGRTRVAVGVDAEPGDLA